MALDNPPSLIRLSLPRHITLSVPGSKIVAQGKQAKVLTEAQAKAVLRHLDHHGRYPQRDRAMGLLSLNAGLRANGLACLTCAMVTDAHGEVGDTTALPKA